MSYLDAAMANAASIITQLKARIRELEEENEKLRAIIVDLRRTRSAKGGAARAEKLSAEQRREIARKAAAARWARKTPSDS